MSELNRLNRVWVWAGKPEDIKGTHWRDYPMEGPLWLGPFCLAPEVETLESKIATLETLLEGSPHPTREEIDSPCDVPDDPGDSAEYVNAAKYVRAAIAHLTKKATIDG